MGPAGADHHGVLFLLHEVRGSMFDFSNTWPFILIVIGAILLASSLAPMDGHIDSNGGADSGHSPKPDPQRLPGSAQKLTAGTGR